MKSIIFLAFLYVLPTYSHDGPPLAKDGCHFCRKDCNDFDLTKNTRHHHLLGKTIFDCSKKIGRRDPKILAESKSYTKNQKKLTKKIKKNIKIAKEKYQKEMALLPPPHNFFQFDAATKKRLSSIHIKLHNKTFFCGCSYNSKLKIDKRACTFQYKLRDSLTDSVRWTHVVPISTMRDHIKTKIPIGDMYNIVPAIGKIDKLRKNLPFNLVTGEKKRYGKCDLEISYKSIEPRDKIRGDVARIYFYMEARYNIKFNYSMRKTFVRWNRDDPPDEWECKRAHKIVKIQGNRNTFITNGCVTFH